MSHFYLRDGTPLYEVPMTTKSGMRPAHVGDARKAGAYPSVTTVTDLIAKPQLERWKINQAIMAALTNPHIRPEMDEDEILAILRADGRQQAEQAAKDGTAVHDAIEAAFKGKPVPKKYTETVNNVVELLYERCGGQEWEAEKWFCSPPGFGGKIDLISNEWTVDFKTKEGPASDHRMYDDQFMQLVAYDKGNGGGRRKANVIVSRDIPGSVYFWDWDDHAHKDEDEVFEQFLCLLRWWQIDNKMEPLNDTE